MEKRKDANSNKIETMRAGMDMMKLKAKLDKRMHDAKTDEEKSAIAKEMEEGAVDILLRVLWTTTVVDITSTIYETCQMVFMDHSVDKETLKLRAKAVKSLGQIFMDTQEKKVENEEYKDAKRLYEEAAFAAMLETIKRKDDAAHGAK
jgi:X-domain of DnaJ-containing